MDEKERWNSRYMEAEEPFYGNEPSAFLARSLGLLPASGRCLDLGGGEGRNALFLARRGWEVTVVDVALAGVARCRALGADVRGRVRLTVADLAVSPLRVGEGTFDLALAVNFHDRQAIGSAARWLRPGGALLVEGFAVEQLAYRSGGPRDAAHLWRPNELLQLAQGLRVQWYEDHLVTADDNPRHLGPKWVVRMIAIRPA